MTTNQIEKLLNLLKDNKLDELKDALTTELLKSTDKTTANLFTAVKKYLKNTDNARPVLKTVQHMQGKQFILNGYSAFVFNEYQTALDELPNTTDETQCFNVFQLINSTADYSPLEYNDIIILKNIKKYISYYKLYNNIDRNKSTDIIPVFWHDKFFNANLLAETLEFLQPDDLKIAPNCHHFQLKTNSITAIILPLNITKSDEQQKIIDFTNKFLDDFQNC